jgi:uncharacterized protein YgiM (DUF1202 family)
MKTLRVVAVVIVTLIILTVTGFFLVNYLKPKPAGIMVDTTPASSVYIDGKLAGKTPLRKTYKAGAINLRLIPDSSTSNLLPYETKITLMGGIETVVRREFGETEDLSSGDVISFQGSTGKTTSIIVLSTPDNAQVSLDGVVRGFAPYKNSTISPAEHQIAVKAPGYQDRTMITNTHIGYQLTVFVKLAKSGQTNTADTPMATPIPSPTPKTYVMILKTPTGFLRVRTLPGTAGEEIAEVKPGEKYLYLETDDATNWYKIQYEVPQPGLPNGIIGWVSNQYTQIATESGTLP